MYTGIFFLVIEELKSREKVIRVERNYVFDNEGIYALIECIDKIYLVRLGKRLGLAMSAPSKLRLISILPVLVHLRR